MTLYVAWTSVFKMKWSSFRNTWHKLCSILCHHYLFRYYWSNLHDTTDATSFLDILKLEKNVTGQSQGTAAELYPGILYHFVRSMFFSNCVGGIRMRLWSSVMTVSTSLLTPLYLFSPQPQKLQFTPFWTWQETYPKRWTNFTATKLPFIGAVNQP